MINRRTFFSAAQLLGLLLVLSSSLWAQWPNYPTRGVPKTKDGKPDLNAPAPRTADGKPDLSGLWEAGRGPGNGQGGGGGNVGGAGGAPTNAPHPARRAVPTLPAVGSPPLDTIYENSPGLP